MLQPQRRRIFSTDRLRSIPTIELAFFCIRRVSEKDRGVFFYSVTKPKVSHLYRHHNRV